MDLPNDPNHCYGRKNKPDQFSAGSLLTTWGVPQVQTDRYIERDYCKINKMCVEKGIADAKAVKEFRKDVDVKKVVQRKDLMTAPPA